MERYLLFDGKCAVCTSLARNIERETVVLEALDVIA